MARPEPLSPGRHRDAPKVPQVTRTHWLVLAVLVVVIAVSLLVQGYTHHLYSTADDGVGRPPGPSGQVPSAVSGGGPVISAAGRPRTAQVRTRIIALTFDDGPDPVWTPKILEVLRRNHVHATFFVVGTHVAADPEILRQIVADGHQVGVHTFTHTDLGRVSPWRQSLELNETQLVIAGATGRTTSLLRPPYSSANDSLDNAEWAAVRGAAGQGYLTVLTTVDSGDWRRPGIDHIVANATPKGARGQVVVMHDAGGDRTQTVAALERLLPRLASQGYTFATVGDAVGMASPMRPASATSAGLGLALIVALRFIEWLMDGDHVAAVCERRAERGPGHCRGRGRPTAPAAPDEAVGSAGHRACQRHHPGVQRECRHRGDRALGGGLRPPGRGHRGGRRLE